MSKAVPTIIMKCRPEEDAFCLRHRMGTSTSDRVGYAYVVDEHSEKTASEVFRERGECHIAMRGGEPTSRALLIVELMEGADPDGTRRMVAVVTPTIGMARFDDVMRDEYEW